MLPAGLMVVGVAVMGRFGMMVILARRAVPLIDRFWSVPAFEKYLPLDSQWFMFGIGWVLIAVFVLLCG